jgi:hypothetical protein
MRRHGCFFAVFNSEISQPIPQRSSLCKSNRDIVVRRDTGE